MSDLRKTVHVNQVKEIFRLISLGENITTLWLPGGGRTRFGQFLKDKESLQEFIPDNLLEKFVPIYLDQHIGMDNFESYLSTLLSFETGIEDYRKSLIKLITETKRIVFIVDNFSYQEEFLSFISSIRILSLTNINFIFLALENDFQEFDSEFLNKYSFVYQNVIEIPYLQEPLNKEWLISEANKLEVEVDEANQENILNFAGTNPALIKNTIRLLAKYSGDWTLILESGELDDLANRIWVKFSETDQENLRKFAGSLNVENKILKKFEKFRLINNGKLIGNWVSISLSELHDNVEFKIKNNLLIWNSIDLSEILSKNEMKILLALCKDKLVDRDKIYELIDSEDYSDWSIDKAISRLRTKLKKIGINPNIIKTVKGKGYQLTMVRVQ